MFPFMRGNKIARKLGIGVSVVQRVVAEVR